MKDLGTDGGSLSVYYVPHVDQDRLVAIGAALNTGSDNFARFEYCLVPVSYVWRLGFQTEKTEGITADQEVNNWHHDIKALSAERLSRLAWELKYKGTRDVIAKPEIKRTIEERIRGGKIDKARVEPKLLPKLNPS